MPYYRVLPPVVDLNNIATMPGQELRSHGLAAKLSPNVKVKPLLRLSRLIVGVALLTIVLLLW